MILLLMTYFLYPKMICACFHAGTLCHPSLPPFFSILLTFGFIQIVALGLYQEFLHSIFQPVNMIVFSFLFTIFVYFLTPVLAIKINDYLKAGNKTFFKGNKRKDFYLNIIAAWLIAVCVFLIIDFILSMSIFPYCYIMG